MNKQVKININDKDYYCDMEVLKLIERLQDKVELLEYNRYKAIKLIKKNSNYNITLVQNALIGKDIDDLLNILESNDKKWNWFHRLMFKLIFGIEIENIKEVK